MQRKHYEKEQVIGDASKLSVGVVVSAFNEDITGPMFDGAIETLQKWGVQEKSIEIVRVPGSFEIPFGCTLLLSKKKKPDAIVALGCVIKGDTSHDHYIASAVSQGIMQLSIAHSIPIAFGVITTNNLAQAKVRSTRKSNKGIEAAVAALESALLC